MYASYTLGRRLGPLLKDAWQNCHLEQGHDYCFDRNGTMAGKRLIPHLW